MPTRPPHKRRGCGWRHLRPSAARRATFAEAEEGHIRRPNTPPTCAPAEERVHAGGAAQQRTAATYTPADTRPGNQHDNRPSNQADADASVGAHLAPSLPSIRRDFARRRRRLRWVRLQVS